MNDHVYTGNLRRVVDAGTIELELDLGFGVTKEQRFFLHGVNISKFDVLVQSYIRMVLEAADEILVKSYKDGSIYFGDITYRVCDAWYNLSQSIVRNKMGIEYASK